MEKQPKQLQNPELLKKFFVGQKLRLNRKLAYALYTWLNTKMIVLHRPFWVYVKAFEPKQVGKHYRWCVTVEHKDYGIADMWEEWMMDQAWPVVLQTELTLGQHNRLISNGTLAVYFNGTTLLPETATA